MKQDKAIKSLFMFITCAVIVFLAINVVVVTVLWVASSFMSWSIYGFNIMKWNPVLKVGILLVNAIYAATVVQVSKKTFHS